MSDLRLSAREVEDVLAGRQPDGRADLAPLAEVAALLHASREVEPPPPMSDDLLAEIERGVHKDPSPGPRHSRRHKPRHLAAVPARRRAVVSARRPVVSLGAAAALLVGLVVMSSMFRPGGVDSAVSDVGSAIGLDVFRGDSAAQDPSSTTTSTTTTVPPATTAPPQTTTTLPPAPGQAPPGGPMPGAGEDPSWWFTPEARDLFRQFWPDGGWDGDSRGDDSGPDRDRDGDRDGRGDGSGGGEDDNRTSNRSQDGDGDGDGGSSTTMAPSSSTSSPSTTSGGGGETSSTTG
jgi:hypothetical protein